MPAAMRCPACRAGDLNSETAARWRCAACGATFERRRHLGYYVAAVALYSVVLAVGTAMLFDNLIVRQAVLWSLFAVGLLVIGNHARTLRRI